MCSARFSGNKSSLPNPMTCPCNDCRLLRQVFHEKVPFSETCTPGLRDGRLWNFWSSTVIGRCLCSLMQSLQRGCSPGAKQVVLHAFSGNYQSALAGVKAGFYFSVPPCSVNSDQVGQKLGEIAKVSRSGTFPEKEPVWETAHRAAAARDGFARARPCERCETWTPFCVLPLSLNRLQERNEPANLGLSCQLLAELKKLDVGRVREITTQNALRLFPKLKQLANLWFIVYAIHSCIAARALLNKA